MVVTIAGYASMGASSAQESAPDAAVCDSPGLPSGTPTAVQAEPSPGAIEDIAAMDVGTPGAMEPLAAPELSGGAPADAGVTGLITTTIENFITCYNAGQASGDPG